jgi:hypothetical protein
MEQSDESSEVHALKNARYLTLDIFFITSSTLTDHLRVNMELLFYSLQQSAH